MTETPLETELKLLISAEGPLSIAKYMALALGHPRHGYYMGRDPLGARGDFITAPEVSQVFGELIGIWAASTFQMMGAPPHVNLVELGPGRGTLMADLLRAAKVMPGFHDAADVHLVEMSPAFKQNQKVTLSNAGVSVHWHDHFENIPDGPLIVIANEFFDALPVHQYQFDQGDWHERVVGLDEADNLVAGVASQAMPPGSIPGWAQDRCEGASIEVSPTREDVASLIGARIAGDGGYGLFIDYGHLQSAPGDTLQALSKHEYVDILHRPGMCDLTSHVDFAALGAACKQAGAKVHGIVPQGPFLDAMGLDLRVERLARSATRRQVRAIESAVKRLASREEMGELFKIMAISAPDNPVPAPFEGLK
jgi:NADH dehydrogenase [ubiquinone] 1 alpha subcomplex assembly factor 7